MKTFFSMRPMKWTQSAMWEKAYEVGSFMTQGMTHEHSKYNCPACEIGKNIAIRLVAALREDTDDLYS